MKTSCVFSLCLHYTRFASVNNGQKKLRDEIFITEHKSVKIFIKSAEIDCFEESGSVHDKIPPKINRKIASLTVD